MGGRVEPLLRGECIACHILVDDLMIYYPQVGKLLSEQGKYREALDYHRREQKVCSEQGG